MVYIRTYAIELNIDFFSFLMMTIKNLLTPKEQIFLDVNRACRDVVLAVAVQQSKANPSQVFTKSTIDVLLSV